ncbi:MAG TPA: 50S ribosomal protein L32 [Candidatus Azoamicus sp. OHIO1]
MAVQKSKKTRSKRDKRRSENSKITLPTLSIDSETGEAHKRHFLTPNGYYKGKQIFKKKAKKEKTQQKDN